MSTEFNELLSVPHGDKAQVWIVGTRDQIIHLMNEFYVKKIDRTSGATYISAVALIMRSPVLLWHYSFSG